MSKFLEFRVVKENSYVSIIRKVLLRSFYFCKILNVWKGIGMLDERKSLNKERKVYQDQCMRVIKDRGVEVYLNIGQRQRDKIIKVIEYQLEILDRNG